MLLDLFCGAGGCAMGYHRAGFDVLGVDSMKQPNYPFGFRQADAMMYLRNLIEGDHDSCGIHTDAVAAIHASPPCQHYSKARHTPGSVGREYPDLLGKTMRLLEQTGRHWVVENVPGAPLDYAAILCGTMFGLPLRRHRLFSGSFMLMAPTNPCNHRDGDLTVFGKVVQVCGTKAAPYLAASGRTHYRPKRVSLESGQRAMGIDWMNRGELSQTIPPAYTEFIGRQLLAAMEAHG